jgi:hypothetical protein
VGSTSSNIMQISSPKSSELSIKTQLLFSSLFSAKIHFANIEQNQLNESDFFLAAPPMVLLFAVIR